MRSLSHASHFPFIPQKFPVDWHCSFLQPDCWACNNLPQPCTPATGSALGPSFEGAEKNKQRLVLPFCKASCIQWRGQVLSLRVLAPVRSHCCWLWLPWQVTVGWGAEWRMGGKWNISVLCPFRVSFSDLWAKLEGFCWSCLYLRPVPTASVLNSGQGIPEGKEMANSPLGWWYFESWSPPLCLILFTFQSPWRTVPCILSSCIQWEIWW